MAQIIDGKAIAADIRGEVAAEVAALSSAHNFVSLPSPPTAGRRGRVLSWIGG